MVINLGEVYRTKVCLQRQLDLPDMRQVLGLRVYDAIETWLWTPLAASFGAGKVMLWDQLEDTAAPWI